MTKKGGKVKRKETAKNKKIQWKLKETVITNGNSEKQKETVKNGNGEKQKGMM